MMKFCQLLVRSALLKTSFSTILQKPKVIQKVALSTAALSYGLWYSVQKIMNDQQWQIVQTDDNLAEGEVREIFVGPKVQDTILVAKYQGEIYSTQSKCSHFGFSLAKGSLIGDKLLCPLHNAGFSVKTGEADQGPVFSGLKTFKVTRKEGKIFVEIPKTGWDSAPAPFQIGAANVDKSKQIVIIGAGPTALSAAETLRKTGYKGLIYMISKQKEIPYDRTLLSKGMSGQVPGPIRSQEQLSNNGIIVLKGTTVTSINYNHKKVHTTSGEPLRYDKLLIATGCVNRVPNIHGLNQTNYFTLRNDEDYTKINEGIRKQGVKNITIVGGGFIGMEVASAIKLQFKENVNVTVIEAQKVPLQHVLGQKIGKVLQNLSQKNGVKVITGAKINHIENNNHNPTSVSLEGQSIPTDVLIMATGVTPAIEFTKLLQDPKTHGIKTNVYLQSEQRDVYAAGDVASYPFWYTGENARVQHYNEAIYQGSVAALNMNGKKFPVDNIPFFWTRQFNNSLVFTGVTAGWDDVHVTGSLEEMKFVAYYIRTKDNKVLGAAAMGSMNSIQIINEAMKNGVMPSGTTVKAGDFKLESLLAEIKRKNPKCTRCTMCQV